MISFSTTATTADHEAWLRWLPGRAQQGVKAALQRFQDIVLDAAPVDTGALSLSTAVVLSNGESDAAERASAFGERRDVAPLEAAPAPEGISGTASSLAPYAAAVNDGHVTASGSHVAARPFWTAATEILRRTADEDIGRVIREGLP